MKIALVHDDLVQWGGAERMLLALCDVFPDAPIYTSVFDRSNPLLSLKFKDKKVITSFLQDIPGWKSLYKTLLPLYPLSFEQFDFSSFDLVISQTTRFAKAVITKPSTKHICYCHTPPRFLWNYSSQSLPLILQPLLSVLRITDRVGSKRVDLFLAGSKNARQRIKKVYGRDSKVIYPFVDYDKLSRETSFSGGYLLTVSRLNDYKRVDLVIEAANSLNYPLKIVGTGPDKERLERIALSNVDFVGSVNEDLLVKLLAGCKALVAAGEEDFGLTPLEAQALGKPVIALRKGGVLETVLEGESGYFFDEQNEGSLISALKKLDKEGYNEKTCRKQAQQFSKKRFTEQFRRLSVSM